MQYNDRVMVNLSSNYILCCCMLSVQMREIDHLVARRQLQYKESVGCVTFQRGGTSEAGVVHDVRGPGHHRLKGHLLFYVD